MTTITIKNAGKLKKTTFESIEDLVDYYFVLRGELKLQEIDEEELPKNVQQDLAKSRVQGMNNLHDFQG